jgi:hypothetical protein
MWEDKQMTKKIVSDEKRVKAEEERKRHFRLEIANIDNDFVSIKSPILLSKERFQLLEKICEITGEHIQEYVKDALLQKVQVDLENPSQFGQAVCETLLKQWGDVRNDA